MKIIISAIIICSCLNVSCQENFIIRLMDTSISISLNKQYIVFVKGQMLDFKITEKDTLTYNTDLYTFQYHKDFKISTKKIAVGIEQIAILGGEASGILIQSYSSLNPTTLNEMMLQQITKEKISYGYKLEKTSFMRTLISGQEIDVTKAVLKYQDEVVIFEVASLGKKDAGIIIVTIIQDDEENTNSQNLINLMWRSIKVNW